MKITPNILKIAIFATGVSGIVAEYILSTLASYFLGDSILQFTLIVSVMMFSMGIGARISKHISDNLLPKFIFIEFTLSIFVSFSSLLVYLLAAHSNLLGPLIYTHSIIVGLLIGMEIPLVIRLNNEFEAIKVSISSVLEKDYYGSLIGGLFFAFVGLPYLGLTYTPFILGALNFLVALLLFFILYKHVTKYRKIITASVFIVFTAILLGATYAKPIILFGEQKKYKEKVILTKQSKYQRIVMTKWKNDYFLFINGNKQLSTIDEEMYHEPLVHPIMHLAKEHKNILILGGGDGCAVREILKYNSTEYITVVDLDPEMTKLAQTNEIMLDINKGSLLDKKVKVKNADGFHFIETSNEFYDLIIIDLPDPRTIELSRLYSVEFYNLCYQRLKRNGFIITQAGSPYYASRSFKTINHTLSAANFNTLPIHNQILTFGEWGWIIGSKQLNKEQLRQAFVNTDIEDIDTRWINNEALNLLVSFGKDIFDENADSLVVNRISNPVLYRTYLNGNWDYY